MCEAKSYSRWCRHQWNIASHYMSSAAFVLSDMSAGFTRVVHDSTSLEKKLIDFFPLVTSFYRLNAHSSLLLLIFGRFSVQLRFEHQTVLV